MLRNGNTNGTFHVGGNTTASDENSVTSGPLTASRSDPATGANGLLLSTSRSRTTSTRVTREYVLDIKAAALLGSAALAFPENDGLNQEWSVIGCTHPADVLSTGYQFCP